MKCFYHPDRNAIATCKGCKRGLCPECIVDVPPGGGHQGQCEKDVAALNQVNQCANTAYQKAGRACKLTAKATLTIGLFWVGFGLLPINGLENCGVLVLAGCVFLLWSFFSYHNAKYFSEIKASCAPNTAPHGGPAAPVDNSRSMKGPPSVS